MQVACNAMTAWHGSSLPTKDVATKVEKRFVWPALSGERALVMQ